jgi:hypothetical protein
MLHNKHYDDILPVSTPADPHSVLGIGSFLDEAPNFLFPCKQIVGSLQFAMIGTRLDISYAVGGSPPIYMGDHANKLGGQLAGQQTLLSANGLVSHLSADTSGSHLDSICEENLDS